MYTLYTLLKQCIKDGAKAKQTISLGAGDEVHIHIEGIGRNKDICAELSVELLNHLDEPCVENSCSPL
jgi:hypothetical protein